MITVDGEAVNPAGSDDEDRVAVAVRAARVELKLCKALVALNPPPDVSAYMYARIVELVKKLRNNRATDHDVRCPADFSDGELKEAAEIVRAFRALPGWGTRGFQGGTGLRATLGEFALDLAAEIEARAMRNSGP